MRQNAARGMLVFASEDVDAALEMLANTSQTHPLELCQDLIELCREPRNSYRATGLINQLASGDLKSDSHSAQAKRKKLSRRMHSSGFKSLKDLTVDFACREDLAITSLKEFLEVFV
jgi:hypothetical protein